MKVAAAYLRRSKKEADTEKKTGKDVYSLELQLEWAEKVATEDGFTKVIPYADEASGKDLAKRPNLMTLFRDIAGVDKKGRRTRKTKGIKRIYCYAVDRLSRNVEVMERLVPFLEVYSVDIIFGDLSDTVGPNMRLLLSVMGALAEMQLKETKRKSDAGVKRAREAGKIVGRPVSGFRICDDGKDWEPKPWLVEAAALRNNDASEEEIRDSLEVSLSRIARGLARYDAWEDGGVPALQALVKAESNAAMERMTAAAKRRKAEEEEFLAWIQKQVAEYRIRKTEVRRRDWNA